MLLVLTSAPIVHALAQDATKVPRIGYLTAAGPNARNESALRDGLQELGYEEGRHVHIEYRRANGAFDRLPNLARELVALDVAVIVASVTQASLAAQGATTRIPIVMAGVADPIAVGLVPSLARPGGNITGTSGMASDLVGKQVELLKELTPGATRIAVLWNPANLVFQALQLKEAQAAGHALRVDLQMFEARSADEFDAAFAAIGRAEIRSLLILADPMFSTQGETLARRATRQHTATVGANRFFAEEGGLLAYGPDYVELNKRAAVYVDKILKGAKPADLPVERPSRFELVVNLKTARALGITVPQSILARADEVIE